MSIIQEALKKAEKNIKNPKQVSAATATLISSSSSPDRPSVKPSRPAAGADPKAVAVLLIVLVVTALFAARQFYPKKNISAKVSAAAVISKSDDQPALPGVLFEQPKPYVAADAPPEFILNGIMYLEGSPRAIVNDSMVEAGDMVGGARVVKIEKRNVLLEYDGAELRLDLK